MTLTGIWHAHKQIQTPKKPLTMMMPVKIQAANPTKREKRRYSESQVPEHGKPLLR